MRAVPLLPYFAALVLGLLVYLLLTPPILGFVSKHSYNSHWASLTIAFSVASVAFILMAWCYRVHRQVEREEVEHMTPEGGM